MNEYFKIENFISHLHPKDQLSSLCPSRRSRWFVDDVWRHIDVSSVWMSDFVLWFAVLALLLYDYWRTVANCDTLFNIYVTLLTPWHLLVSDVMMIKSWQVVMMWCSSDLSCSISSRWRQVDDDDDAATFYSHQQRTTNEETVQTDENKYLLPKV